MLQKLTRRGRKAQSDVQDQAVSSNRAARRRRYRAEHARPQPMPTAGPSRAVRRDSSAPRHRLPVSGLLGQRVDAEAIAYKAWVAGCRGRALTKGDGRTTYDVPTPPLSARHLEAIYVGQTGKQMTPAQSRRVRKARNVEVGR